MPTYTAPKSASRTRLIDSARTEITIEVRTGLLELEGYMGDHIEAQFEFVSGEVGPGRIELPATSIWAPLMNTADSQNIFIHANVNGKWWTGRVDRVRKKKSGKRRTLVLELVSDFVWLEAMFAWPSSNMPLGLQIPTKDVRIAPAKTMVASYIHTTIFRLQADLWRFPVGFMNDPVKHFWKFKQQPCVMLPHNPIFDSSRISSLQARMTSLAELFKQVLLDEHLELTATAWVKGRDPQPSNLVELKENCIVFDIIDKRRKQGSQGTILDGLFSTIIDTVGPIFSPVIGLLTGSSSKYTMANFFGTDPADPWVVFRDDDHDDIEESEIVINTLQAHTGIVGGHSPDWVNKGITLLINSAIQGLLSAAGIGFLGNLIAGELDDIVMAFQSATNEEYRRKWGVFTLPEAFEGTGTTAFTFDAVQQLRRLMFQISPSRSFHVTMNDGLPFIPFKHFDVGDPVGWEDEDMIYTDYVTRIVVTDNRSSRAKIQITIGKEDDAEEPMAAVMRRVQGVKAAFDYWTLAGSN